MKQQEILVISPLIDLLHHQAEAGPSLMLQNSSAHHAAHNTLETKQLVFFLNISLMRNARDISQGRDPRVPNIQPRQNTVQLQFQGTTLIYCTGLQKNNL